MSAVPFAAGLERAIERADKPRKRAKALPRASWEQKQREAAAMVSGGDWSSAKPAHFVALYAMGHARAYGVEAGELTPKTRMSASAMAGRMLRDDFGGDPRRLYEFVRWTWSREKAREEWRRANGRETRRISWQLQFGPHLRTDYEMHLLRKK